MDKESLQAEKTKPDAFRFKQFQVQQDRCAMKVNTDGVLLGAWTAVAQRQRALDIGTGTGVIAMMLAQRAPQLNITGVEIDADSAAQAAENMAATPWKDRLSCVQVPVQEFARNAQETFDLIVCNPPFFSGGVLSEAHDRNVVRHTVKLPHGELLHAVRNLLSKDGVFTVILPWLEGLRFQELASHYGLQVRFRVDVRGKVGKPVERILLQLERNPCELQQSELTIQEEGPENNLWTEEYKSLVKDFYIHM